MGVFQQFSCGLNLFRGLNEAFKARSRLQSGSRVRDKPKHWIGSFSTSFTASPARWCVNDRTVLQACFMCFSLTWETWIVTRVVYVQQSLSTCCNTPSPEDYGWFFCVRSAALTRPFLCFICIIVDLIKERNAVCDIQWVESVGSSFAYR